MLASLLLPILLGLPEELDKLIQVVDPKKSAEPAWRAEFQKAYGLKDGEVLKRVAPPFAPSRAKWFAAWIGDALQPPPSADQAFLIFRFRDNKVTYGTSHVHGPAVVGAPRGTLSFVLERGLGLPLQSVDAVAEVLDLEVDGDFVFRTGTPPEKWVPVLEKTLRTDCALPLRFKWAEAEREVVVLSGEYKSKPREGQRLNSVVVAADPAGALEGGSIGTYDEFLMFLSKFTGKRIMSDVKRPPAVQFNWRHRSATMTRRNGQDSYTEVRDPDTVLKAVAEQTGLKFTTENRKVWVLSIIRE
jgi:hypothetical protein